MNKQEQKIHFIGIGGIGMSGLAFLAQESGYQVSGSDIKENDQTRLLGKMGVNIMIPHQEENVKIHSTVVFSSAISPKNVEYMRATAHGSEMLHRSEFLDRLLDSFAPLCVSGSHGKTTVSGLLSHILVESGWDPMCVVGGVHPQWRSNVRKGKGPWAVIEADESDGSLLNYSPFGSVITNIDREHMDHYGSMENLEATFKSFLDNTSPRGLKVVCGDDEILFKLAENNPMGCLTYGFHSRNLFQIEIVKVKPRRSSFRLLFRGIPIGELTTPLLGVHNILNSGAAAVFTLSLGVPFHQIQRAVESFTGMGRRQELIFKNEVLQVFDDYAHHPTEMDATLQGLREVGNGRLVLVFQPHRYSRTETHFKEFARALDGADRVYLLPVYGAGEENPKGVDSTWILKELPLSARKKVKLTQNFEQTLWMLDQDLKEGDTIVTMGAGDVRKIAEKMKNLYQLPMPLIAGSR